jgi:hypothetical protein
MYPPGPVFDLISKRALALAAVVALVAAVIFATATTTSAQQAIVHTHLGKAGTIVVTGYDGGAPLAPPAP